MARRKRKKPKSFTIKPILAAPSFFPAYTSNLKQAENPQNPTVWKNWDNVWRKDTQSHSSNTSVLRSNGHASQFYNDRWRPPEYLKDAPQNMQFSNRLLPTSSNTILMALSGIQNCFCKPMIDHNSKSWLSTVKDCFSKASVNFVGAVQPSNTSVSQNSTTSATKFRKMVVNRNVSVPDSTGHIYFRGRSSEQKNSFPFKPTGSNSNSIPINEKKTAKRPKRNISEPVFARNCSPIEGTKRVTPMPTNENTDEEVAYLFSVDFSTAGRIVTELDLDSDIGEVNLNKGTETSSAATQASKSRKRKLSNRNEKSFKRVNTELLEPQCSACKIRYHVLTRNNGTMCAARCGHAYCLPCVRNGMSECRICGEKCLTFHKLFL